MNKVIKLAISALFFAVLLLAFPSINASASDYTYEFRSINAAVLTRGDMYFRYDKDGNKKINALDSSYSKKKFLNYLLDLSTSTEATTTEPVTTEPPVTTPYIVPGIDVSRWQETIDWNQVKASGMDFAIIRAGYGRLVEQEDGNFRVNIQGAKAAGLNCGVYWYSYALTPEDAIVEAQACLSVIKGYKFEYPIFFDIEESSQRALGKDTVSAIINAFCSTVESQGYYVGIYSCKSFLVDCVNTDILNRYDVWIAQWNNEVTYTGPYGIWQYTSEGMVNGINGRVDLNISYKNYPEIMKTYHLNGY